MPSQKLPAYRRHKASGQAVVTLSGRDFYLGPWGTKLSRANYDRVVAEWLGNGRALPASPQSDPAAVTVQRLLAAWWTSGKIVESQRPHWRKCIGILRRLYGTASVEQFGPVALKAFRQQLVAERLSRTTINKYVQQVRRIFRYGVSCELVPVDVAGALDAVEGLRRGEADVPEPRKVKPVADAMVDQVVAQASPTLAAMIRVQRATGMRAGEIVIMRTGDLDRTGDVWTYSPRHHKGTHREQTRTVFIGPRSQAVLTPFLKLDPDAFLFSPADAERERRDIITAGRKTRAGQGNTPGSNRKRVPAKRAGVRYTTESYRQAIEYACDRAFPVALPADLARRDDESLAAWRRRLTPESLAKAKTLTLDWQRRHRFATHQLRHAKGREIRREFGLDVAQAVLGHKHAKTTEIYSELEQGRAREAAAKLG